MDSVTNGYDHASITDSILTSLPSGVGSMAVICAAAIIPLAIHKAKMHSMQKEINELEASMGKDNWLLDFSYKKHLILLDVFLYSKYE